jgi:hypothetical protein
MIFQAEDGIGIPMDVLTGATFERAVKFYFLYIRFNWLWSLNLFALVLLNFLEVGLHLSLSLSLSLSKMAEAAILSLFLALCVLSVVYYLLHHFQLILTNGTAMKYNGNKGILAWCLVTLTDTEPRQFFYQLIERTI